MQFFLGFVIFAAAIYGIMIASAMVKLRKLRWTQREFYAPVSADDADPTVVALLQDTAGALAALGFEPASWYRIHEPHAQDDRVSFSWVFYHPGYHSYALAGLHPLPESGQAVAIEFLNVYDDHVCYTSNGTRHFAGITLDGYDWDDPYVPTLDQHWAFHRERLSRCHSPARTLSTTQFADWGNRFLGQYQQTLCDHGEMTPAGKDRFRMTVRGCWRTIRRLQKSTKRVQALQQAHAGNKDNGISAEVEVLAHQRQDSMLGATTRNSASKTLLLLGSVALFMLSFGYRMDFESLVVLLGVLFFHELGHVAAMRLFGYRDLQILFIPFLGAVATGQKTRCPAWQSAVIYLAGPVPGIVVATMLGLTGIGAGFDWMPLLLAMLLFVNFFNLLPIQPLDGGQLANVLLFQRWPRLQVLFNALSVLVFLLMAWLLDEPLLAGIGFMLGFSMLHQYREARLLNHLRQSQPELPDNNKGHQLQSIYQGMHVLGLPWTFCTRQQAARNLLDRLASPLPRLWESTLGLALYLALLLGTPATLLAWSDTPLYAFWPQDNYTAPDWEAELQDAASDEQRIDILTEAAEYFFYSEQADRALDYSEQAIQLLTRNRQAETFPMADALLLRAQIRLDYADLTEGKLAHLVQQDVDDAIAIYQRRAATQQSTDRLGQAYELNGQVAEMLGNTENALRQWVTASDYRRQFPELQAYNLSYNFKTQGRLYRDLGDLDMAGQRYRDSLAWARRADPDNTAYATESALRDLLAFYLDQQYYQQAVSAFADHSYPDNSEYHYYQAELTAMAAWANFKLQRFAEAEAHYETAIALIDQRRAAYPGSRPGYRKADNIARLLLLHHVQNQQGSARVSAGSAARDLPRLLAELDAIDRSVVAYKKHLECECERNAGGYRLERSEQTRDAVNRYLPDSGQTL